MNLHELFRMIIPSKRRRVSARESEKVSQSLDTFSMNKENLTVIDDPKSVGYVIQSLKNKANSKGIGKTQQRLQDIIESEAPSETLVGESSAETISIAHIYGCWGSRGNVAVNSCTPLMQRKKIGEDPNLDLHWATPTGKHPNVSPFADHWWSWGSTSSVFGGCARHLVSIVTLLGWRGITFRKHTCKVVVSFGRTDRTSRKTTFASNHLQLRQLYLKHVNPCTAIPFPLHIIVSQK